MVKYALIMFLFTTFIVATDNYKKTKPSPKPILAMIENDDNEKLFRRRRGKSSKGRRRGGSGLR